MRFQYLLWGCTLVSLSCAQRYVPRGLLSDSSEATATSSDFLSAHPELHCPYVPTYLKATVVQRKLNTQLSRKLLVALSAGNKFAAPASESVAICSLFSSNWFFCPKLPNHWTFPFHASGVTSSMSMVTL